MKKKLVPSAALSVVLASAVVLAFCELSQPEDGNVGTKLLASTEDGGGILALPYLYGTSAADTFYIGQAYAWGGTMWIGRYDYIGVCRVTPGLENTWWEWDKDDYDILYLSLGSSGDTVYTDNWYECDDDDAVGSWATRLTKPNLYAYGESGNDTINGGPNGDRLEGGEGNDHLYGNDGSDTIIGNDGDDYADGGAGGGTIYGDSTSYSASCGTGDTCDDLLYGGIDGDTIHGGADEDCIYGQGGSDWLFGDKGTCNLVHAGPATGTDTCTCGETGSPVTEYSAYCDNVYNCSAGSCEDCILK